MKITFKNLPTTGRFPETIPDAFYNKNYKFIRVAVDYISRLCLAAFYRIISYYYRVMGSSTAHHYESLALYQSERTKKFFTYLRFGGEIVDFCVNAPQQIKSSSSAFFHNVIENQALRSIYEDEAIDEWIQILIKDASPKLEMLRRLKITDGCCLGMSLDFISHYLLNVSSGEPILFLIAIKKELQKRLSLRKFFTVSCIQLHFQLKRKENPLRLKIISQD